MALTKAQTDGVTKARLACNLTRGADEQHADNGAYIAGVTEMAGLGEFPTGAADDYAKQHAGTTIAALEAELTEKLAEKAE